MGRSLFSQLLQIENSVTYDDTLVVSNAEVGATTLEEDLNFFRSSFKEIKGTTNWMDNLIASSDDSVVDIQGIINRTPTSALRRLSYVQLGNPKASGTGSSVVVTTDILGTLVDEASTDKGILASTTKGNVINSGGKNKIALLNATTGDPITDGNGNRVFGYLFTDNINTPTVKTIYFYSADGSGVETVYTFSVNTNLIIIYLQRFDSVDVPEDFGLSDVTLISNLAQEVNLGNMIYTENNFVINGETHTNSIDNLDIELADVFTALGIVLGNDVMAYTSTNNILAGDTVNGAVSKIDTAIGNRTYTGDNYVVDGESVTSSIDSLDIQLKVVTDLVGAGISVIEQDSTAVSSGGTFNISGNPVIASGKLLFMYQGQTLRSGVSNDYIISNPATGELTIYFNMPAGKNLVFVDLS